MPHEGEIEIAIDVEIAAGVAFWIDRTEWTNMAAEARKSRIEKAIEKVSIALCNDVIPFEETSLSAEITGPGGDEIKLENIRLYDPEDWE